MELTEIYNLGNIYNADLPTVNPDKMSTILFTSGTTGEAKGVMLTQRNIASNVIQGLGAVDLRHNQDVIMSVLPLNHAYEFTCTVLGMLYKGVPICISSGLKYLQKELSDYQPTVVFVVPIFAETLYKKVELNIKNKRKKNLIILNTGENISAEELEEKIQKIPDVTEVIVYAKNNTIIIDKDI